jgi:hypothetical protein
VEVGVLLGGAVLQRAVAAVLLLVRAALLRVAAALVLPAVALVRVAALARVAVVLVRAALLRVAAALVLPAVALVRVAALARVATAVALARVATAAVLMPEMKIGKMRKITLMRRRSVRLSIGRCWRLGQQTKRKRLRGTTWTQAQQTHGASPRLMKYSRRG